MAHQHDHIVATVWAQQKAIFENTRQGVFIYTDEGETRCNQNFADILGLKNPEEWERIPNPLMVLDEQDGSQAKIMIGFEDGMNNQNAESFDVTWIKKNGEHQKTHLIIFPYACEGHLIAVHFVIMPLT